ncbi:MAG TPA: hypothetical protein VE954_14750 [Oligoflexus sp.]|uniref:DUF7713 domain-containing protein n=1 Tax=Oligoflexus sp. TaxID=1971216 RepID=UPI002D2447DE|nr:hypothetical protein [Oligoflexus sp.]HYX34360.1 hypothetical protein [Oligoflexus sp.]
MNSAATFTCQACQKVKPAVGSVHLRESDGSKSHHVCSSCYNAQACDRMGIARLETSEIPHLIMLDLDGIPHTFSFEVMMTTGLGIRALELLEDGQIGYSFGVLEHPETPVAEAYAKLLVKITAALSVRYIHDGNGFESWHRVKSLAGSVVVGRIDEGERAGETIPTAIIDGREYSWEEFGRLLTSYTGFNFRLECLSDCETMDLSPDPKRPDPRWWLDKNGKGDAEWE